MKKILAGLVCFLIASCGFEPLYVQKQHHEGWYFGGKFDTSISEEMAKVDVEPIADRFGQEVRNQLLDLLTPKGVPAKPKYRLYVVLTAKDTYQQAMRRDITATSERVIYRVEYRLLEDNEQLVHGNSVAYLSYDILDNPYSTTMAQKKTETDGAKIIANDIALRLGAYFHSKHTNKGSFDDFQAGTN